MQVNSPLARFVNALTPFQTSNCLNPAMLAHQRVMLIPDLYSTEPPHLVPGSEKVCYPYSTEGIVNNEKSN